MPTKRTVSRTPSRNSSASGKAKPVVDKHYAKSEDYHKVLETIEQEGECPFCPSNFKHHPKPTLREEGNWFITDCGWPYENTSKHFLIIGKAHKEQLAELAAEDFADILKLVQWAGEEFEIPGGAFAMRFGNTAYTGATVCHLHAHLIVPAINVSGRARTVLFPIG